MSHLGARAAQLVDGQLSAAESERACEHLARCPDCRRAVEAERVTKQRLRALAAPPASADLTRALVALAGPGGPLPPRPPVMPGSLPVPVVAFSAGGGVGSPLGVPLRPPRRHDPASPSDAPSALSPVWRQRPHALARPGRRRGIVAVVGAIGAVGAGVVGVAVVGAGAPRTVEPPAGSFLVNRVVTSPIAHQGGPTPTPGPRGSATVVVGARART